jgi:hypothetical protein
MPRAETSTVHLLRHVDFEPTSVGDWRAAVADIVQLWKFTTSVLTG